MKKSKVIVPAVAMIAFSTAASIAGSVAWFTASRQAVISAGTYAVVKTTSNLDVKLAAGVGTSVDGKTVTFGGRLTDGSYNHTSGKVYQPTADGKAIDQTARGEVDVVSYDATKADEVSAVATSLERATVKVGSSNVKVYTAATFDITFTVNFGAVEADIGLFLNCTGDNSKFSTDAATPITAKGFRMGFYPISVPTGSAGAQKVFADLQESGKCKYVAGKDNYAGTAYTGSALIDSAYSDPLPTTSTSRADALARADYLGTFKFASQAEVSITIRVVAWFEGTDENIVNQALDANYQSVASQLTFEAIELQPAA